MTHDKTGGPAFPAQPKYEHPVRGYSHASIEAGVCCCGAALAQIDAEPAEPRQPTVKPLEWDWTGGYGLICKADTQIGTYSIHQDEDSAAGALLMYLHLTEDGDCTRYAIEWREYLEPEEMQAIAQADYERRILSAIEYRQPTVQEAARVLIDVFSDGASHVPQHQFWMAYWENCGSDEQDVYGGVIAALRALAEGDSQ